MKYKTINEALAAIIAGESVEAVAAGIQGTMDYAIDYYDCSRHEEAAMRALRAAYVPKTLFTKPTPAEAMAKASCGCTVAKSLLMMASLGSSCADCYDRMSG